MIDAVRDVLPPEQSHLLIKQLEQVNLIHRDPHERVVNLFHNTFSKSGFEPATKFANKEDQLLLAVVKLSRPGDKKQLRAEFWVVGGHLFEIAYSISPTKFFGVSSLDQVESSIAEVKIYADPQVDRWVGASRIPITPSSLESIRGLLGSSDISNLNEAYEVKIVQRELERFNADFPDVYAELLSHCDGCQVGECKIMGIRSTWTVETELGKFQILAERESMGLIAVKVVAVDGEIYFIDVIDDTIEKLGKDFAKALRWINDRPYET